MMDEPKVSAQKIGGIGHGYVEGYPDIDERALTAEIAERKAREAACRLSEHSASARKRKEG